MDMGGESNGTRLAGIEIAKLTRILTSWAAKNPNDEEAQRRARVAVDFYKGVTKFPEIVVDEVPREVTSLPSPARPIHHGHPERLLPTEIYLAIIAHVLDFDYATRQKTLVSLSASSKMFRRVAEQHLYTHPRGAHSVERQWKFMFSLALEPERGHFVRSLEFGWFALPNNARLIIDILHACPNVQDIGIQRGWSASDVALITGDDVSDMAAILEASPRVTHFWYATFTKWLSEPDRHGNDHRRVFEMCAEDHRFARFARQLQELSLHGQLQWLLRALVPHISPTLKSLTLGQDINLDFDPLFFTRLASRSPHLEGLEILCDIDMSDDLPGACKTWGKTLRKLWVSSIDEIGDHVEELISPLRVLEDLYLGPGCFLTFRDLDSIVKSLPHQRFTSVCLEDLEELNSSNSGSSIQHRLDQAIAALILSHSSTLKILDLASGAVEVGKPAIVSCKQAGNLEEFNVSPTPDVTGSDVDALLEACPKLRYVTERFQRVSLRSEQWKKRCDARSRESDEKFERLPPSLG